jgi:hypothetical protein
LKLMPLDEMIARIDALRLEEAPACCPTCGSTVASETLTLRWCSSCQAHRPRHAFYADRAAADGLQSHCKACSNAARKRARTQHALRVLRRAS